MYREGALCFTFSGVPSSLSRLCSPGEKEGKKVQGRKSKNETQASNCQICDNAKFHHYYPGYAGNHFTRLRRHLGLNSDINFKPLTSRFAKAIALSLNCPCVKWLLEHRAGETPLELGQQWRSQTSSKAPPPGDQGGPARSPQWPWAAPAAHTGAAPTSTQPCCCQHEIPVQRGSQSHTSSAVTDPSRVGVFPSPAWHPQLLHWNLPFGCSQELGFMILLPPWDLAADYSFRVLFNTRKKPFFSHPAGGKLRSRTRIILSFGESFCFFARGKGLACSRWAFPPGSAS